MVKFKKHLTTFFILLFSSIIIFICLYFLLKKTNNIEYGYEVSSSEMIGAGGYGAIFDAKINPYNKNYFACLSDMGGAYFSFDKGQTFTRQNILGTLYALQYDTSTPGVVWLAGSGVYKSIDNGQTFEMVFPQESDVEYTYRNYENMNYWLCDKYDSSSEFFYPSTLQMKSLTINENSNGNNVFVCTIDSWVENVIKIYSTEDGNKFSLFCKIERENFTDCQLFYNEKDECLLVVAYSPSSSKIFSIDKNKNIKVLYVANKTITGFDEYYDSELDKNIFVLIQKRDTNSILDDSNYDKYINTDIYVFDDFLDKNSWINLAYVLTDENKGLDNSYSFWTDNIYYFLWNLSYVDIVNENNIYFFHKTDVYVDNSTKHNVYGYIKYDNGRFIWVFGSPYKNFITIENMSWQDSDQGTCYGICGTSQDPDFLLFGTIVGIYYAENNGDSVYQCNSKLMGEIILTTKDSLNNKEEIVLQRYKSTGIDVQTTYEIIIDPFNDRHLVMTCTDFGLLHSFDNGDTWVRNVGSVSYDFRNTCYDFEFDKNQKGVAYSIWCSLHDAPYYPSSAYFNCNGMFGISYDSGITWTFKSIKSDNKILPYKLLIDYSNKTTLYIASEGNGIYVSNDYGDTFISMNQNIISSDFYGNNAIFANDIITTSEGIFIITSGLAPDESTALYRWNSDTKSFDNIKLPEQIQCVRDICYSEKNKCLYLAVVGNNEKNAGIYCYKNQVFTQIFDENISVFGLALDSNDYLFATTLTGEIFYFNNNLEYTKLNIQSHHMLKNITFGNDGLTVYVSSFGGGMQKIVLKKVY